MKKSINFSNTGKRNFFRWWYILIALVVIIAAGITGTYYYINSHVQQKVSYVNNWSAANSAANNTSSSSSADESGLDALDAGDFSKVQTKDYPIIKVKQKDPNIENILIIGIDGGAEGGVGVNRADSMMVASINTKNNTLKLSSLLRDTKVLFPNTNTRHKLNAAFSYGGPGLQIDIINYAYQLDIQKYVEIDFSGFQKIIDTVGGVPITLTAQEASYSYINVGTSAGTYNLDGAHCLGYTRTRKIDTDFTRTQRQRNVIYALIDKFKGVSATTKLAAANECLGYVKTNIPTTELFGNLLTFESNMKNVQQITIPTDGDGMYTTETHPIWFWDLDWNKEVPRLQNFIYGN